MESDPTHIAKTFRDLRVYRAAQNAARDIFVVSQSFPKEERYSLTDQVRRSSRAVKAMIAEAWGRRRYVTVFVSKIDEALGEANETRSWLGDALDCGYIDSDGFARMDAEWDAIAAMLSRMIDRAPDFCKHAPNFDYRVKEDEEP